MGNKIEDNKGKSKENFIIGIIKIREDDKLEQIIINSYKNAKDNELIDRDALNINKNENENEIKN